MSKDVNCNLLLIRKGHVASIEDIMCCVVLQVRFLLITPFNKLLLWRLTSWVTTYIYYPHVISKEMLLVNSSGQSRFERSLQHFCNGIIYQKGTCTKSTSWKESLNSEGQQFHQYQLNELSPLTTTQWHK